MYILVAIAIALCAVQISADIQKDEGVLVLNVKISIRRRRNTNAPWCGHCKALAPEYAKAAQKLEEEGSEIKLGKVDATEEPQLAEKHEVRGYPTLVFFRDGKPMPYGGGRTSDEIISWLKKKTGPAAKTLASAEEAEAFKEAHPVVIIGYFQDVTSDGAKTFLEVAASIDDIPFGITSDETVVKKDDEATTPSVVLFKKFDERRNEYSEEVTTLGLTKFISINSMPLVTEFSHETAQKIFGGEIKSHALLFSSKAASDFAEKQKVFLAVAEKFRGRVLFVSIDTDVDENGRILEFFGITTEELPSIRLIRLEDDMTKFKPESNEISESYLTKYVQQFVEGKLKAHLLSQTLPEDWDKNPVKVLVSKNFDQVVFDKSKDVLVEFYAPWCGHCKQLAPIYDQLGEKFKEDSSVLVAKIDSTVNELEHTKVQSFPTLKLYKRDTNEIIEYNGERTMDGLVKFLETKGEYGRAPPERAINYDGARTLEGLTEFLNSGGKIKKVQETEDEEEEDDDDDDKKKDKDEL
uniref:Protein disulfide-isomerase n=1 Tax=Strigamia maritima TaxID=126957 RepID=T1JKD8_STRMM